MKTWLKWIGIILISIILILIIAGFLLTKLVKPGDIKPLLTQQIYKATGQQVEFNGKLHFSLFPTLSLQMNDALIKNPEGFGDQPLADIKNLSVGVKLFPLLGKKIETTDLSLNDVTLNLINNRNGQTNWALKKANGKTPSPSTSATTAAPKKSTPISLAIPAISIQNMNLNWTNEQNGQHTIIKPLNFSAKNIQHETSFPVSFDLYLDNNKPQAKGSINATATMSLSKENDISFQTISLNTDLVGNGLPQNRLKMSLNGKGNITTTNAKFDTIKLNLNNNKISGNLTIQNYTTFPTNFNFNINPFVAGKLSGTATINGNLTLATAATTPAANTTNGTVTVDVQQGTYRGVNAQYLIATALALINKNAPPAPPSSNSTTFNNLHTTLNIKNGVATTNDFRVSSPIINVQGAGTINFVNNTIDMSLRLSSAMSNNIYTQNIPITISGSLSSPSISIDQTEILKKVLSEQLQKQINRSLKNIDLNKLFN